MEFCIDKCELFEYLCQSTIARSDRESFVQYVFDDGIQRLNLTAGDIPSDKTKAIKDKVASFHKQFCKKWKFHHRHAVKMRTCEVSFMSGVITETVICSDDTRDSRSQSRPRQSVGRPSKSFDEAAPRSKRRRVAEISQQHTTCELVMAAARSAADDSNSQLSGVLKESISTPKRAEKLRQGLRDTAKLEASRTLSADEALAVTISADLSARGYNVVRKMTNKASAVEVFPPYHKVTEARAKCFPEVRATETSAEVELQDMLDHTVQRLFAAEKETLLSVVEAASNATDSIPSTSRGIELSAVLRCKWGFDGATGQSVYKQARTGSTYDNENSLFCTTFVPLRLDINDTCAWTNEKPSSTRYCRPLHVQYVKETAQISRQERDCFAAQIANLKPCIVEVGDASVQVRYEMQLTMIDGKVSNALTNTTSTQTCNVCGAKPTEMNHLDRVRLKPPDPNTYQYGLSTLHAWIRLFELVLHLGYRMKLKVWSVKAEKRDQFIAEKKRIQGEFLDKMGLPVDQPRAGGAGSSNDGNMARRAFADPATFSSITGVDQCLILRFSVILRSLACNKAVDADKFGEFALETARLFVDLYPWYYMPCSLHKLLIHGADVIRSLLLPIGAYSEEAQEARNKHVKWYRLKHSRKTSRTDTMTDQFRQLCVTSDPVITGIIQQDIETKLRLRRARRPARPDEDLRDLLVLSDDEAPTPSQSQAEDSDDDSDTSSSSDEDTAVEQDTTPRSNPSTRSFDASCSLPDYYCE